MPARSYGRGEHPASLANLQRFQAGGPGGPGRPKGSRDALSKAVLRDIMTSAVTLGGASYWTWLARNHPSSYVRVVVELLKQGHVEAIAGGDVGDAGHWAKWLSEAGDVDDGAKERRARALALLAASAVDGGADIG